VALAAGFGLNLEDCDPEVFAALEELLQVRARNQSRADLASKLKGLTG